MILTVTPNPSIDRTVPLVGTLQRGGVHRLGTAVDVAGGKGINVSRVLHAAGVDTLAVVPAPRDSPLLGELAREGLPVLSTPAEGVRVNIAYVEGDGATTKFNEAGSQLSNFDRIALDRAIAAKRGATHTLVLAGSLPPGLADDWYAEQVRFAREAGVRTAVDTSGAPLNALLREDALPLLMKHNAHELAELIGGDGDAFEAQVAAGTTDAVVAAARRLIERGCETVLVTLGSAGALAVQAEGAWVATPPPITPRSTVGAGDSSLAGWLIAELGGESPAECLRRAVATGSAAASLPGTTLPTPGQLDLEHTLVHSVSGIAGH